MFYLESHGIIFVVVVFFSKSLVWWLKKCHGRRLLRLTTNTLLWHLDLQS